jgi:hypothetical protein
MIEIDDIWFETVPDIQAHLDERRNSLGHRFPFADLGYCLCGTVFNIKAMADLNYKRGMCPDCGEEDIAIERAAPSQIEERSDEVSPHERG